MKMQFFKLPFRKKETMVDCVNIRKTGYKGALEPVIKTAQKYYGAFYASSLAAFFDLIVMFCDLALNSNKVKRKLYIIILSV